MLISGATIIIVKMAKINEAVINRELSIWIRGGEENDNKSIHRRAKA